MKIAIASLFFTIFLTAAVAFSWADEKRDHVCFRVLDSNKDGVVSYQEFEKIYSDEHVPQQLIYDIIKPASIVSGR